MSVVRKASASSAPRPARCQTVRAFFMSHSSRLISDHFGRIHIGTIFRAGQEEREDRPDLFPDDFERPGYGPFHEAATRELAISGTSFHGPRPRRRQMCRYFNFWTVPVEALRGVASMIPVVRQ